ncbi:MAG TPA: hypothetical protein VFB59_01530 [Candidatus Saccharimonadales bacterium]|nr:hypothetical protein [Candidatus Saccharimonadales bacterium]
MSWAPEVTITKPEGLDLPRQAIYDVLATVPDYQTYRDSEEVQQGFVDLRDQYRNATDVRVQLEPIQPDPAVKDSLDALFIELPDADELEDHGTVFIMGNVHTNELMWTQTFDFLSKLFAAQPELMRMLGIKRVIFLDAFPGGLKINGDDLVHGTGDITIREYLRNAGRSHQQAVWDFSFDYKDAHHKSSLLGAKVTEEILRQFLPDLLGPLHNAAVNGMYTFISHPAARLVPDLEVLRQAIRPEMPEGAPDSPKIQKFGPGVYPEPTVQDYYDAGLWMAGIGANPASAMRDLVGAAAFYAKYLFLSSEVPCYISSSLLDHNSSGQTMSQILAEIDPEIENMMQQMAAIIASVDTKHLAQDVQHLHEATRLIYKSWRQEVDQRNKTAVDTSPEHLTIADRAKLFIRRVFYIAVTLGQATRLAEQTGNTVAANRANDTLDHIAQMAEDYLQPQFLPRRIQVALQAGTLLLGALAQKEQKDEVF